MSLSDNAMNRRDFITRTGLAAAGGSHFPLQSNGEQGDRWQRDGAATVARLGVLTPDFDPTPESEMWAMAPAGVSIHSARVTRRRRDPSAFAEPPNVDIATDQLVELAPRAILFAYTSSSYALGAAGEIAVRDRLEQRAKGIPIIPTCRAATSALHSLGVHRISLIHPPWFSESLSEQGRVYFRAQGFDVVQCTRLLPARPVEVEIAPAELFDFATSHTPRTAEAVFIGGNGMRAVGAISALEIRLGIPVLSANQILLYDALSVLGQAHKVRNHGKIFEYAGRGNS
jgi:maleate isomerase